MSAASTDVLDVVIAQARAEASHITVLDLASLDGAPLPRWEPGAHIDVKTRDRFGNSVVRQYSLCGESNAATWRIAVLADVNGRGGSEQLCAEARMGVRLSVRGPRNHFQLPSDERPVVLVAGGIGITPLLAMANSLHAQGRAFRLHYFARSRASMAFHDQLQTSPYRPHVHLSFDDDAPAPIGGIFAPQDADAWVYICGPDGFMKAVVASAHAAGISEMRIRKELFSSDPEVPAVQEAGGNRAFSIRLRSSGRVVEVPADKTAVHALADAGVEIVVSCEQGHCGSCLTRVIEGMPDHRDQFMLPEERERNDCFTPCCSRALSETLVLDL
jgi:vanillate O-demethylase ferredoxin subunit